MAYYIIYPLLYLLSLLPMSILYLLGRGISFLLESVLQYRKEVVTSNLRNAFPKKSIEEIETIRQQYYKHLGELFAEIIKLFSASPEFIKKRVSFRNPEVFEQLVQNKRNPLIVMGHTGNWEWAGAAVALQKWFHLLVVYRPVKSPAMDRIFKEMRTRFSAEPVPMQSVFRKISVQEKPFAAAFLADQSAPPEYSCWVNFLNQPTAVFRGVEKISAKTGNPVVFAYIDKVSRGRYEIILRALNAENSSCELTAAHTAQLEEFIIAKPYNWLWSHKRWKHKPPSDQTS